MVDKCVNCPLRVRTTIEAGKSWQAIHGDAMIALRDIPDGSVDLIVTDPPYGTGAHSPSDRLRSSFEKYSSAKTASLPNLAGDSILPDAWQEMMRVVASECLRVAGHGANALFFCDWRAYPMMLRIMSSVGWSPRGLLVWDKGRGTRPVKNGFRLQTEYVLWLRKGGAVDRDGEPVYLDGVFHFRSPPRKYHLTEKPVELISELLRIAPSGAHVLDPFQGSGTTGVAALKRGLRYTGIETVRAYHDTAVQRLRDAESSALSAITPPQ